MQRNHKQSSVNRGAERSFASEVRKLQLGAGETFHGEAILALTKALLQAGVGYVGGYPGAPVSHLMDVLADAREEILQPLGIFLEASASEAGAAALLGASIHYPIRGAVTWKSIVGTNVASDALSNLASAGVTGGALIIIGEDYGEGASVIQERTHPTAVKSSIPLIDPRYHMATMVRLTEAAFELSEASQLPVMMSLRIRAAHMTGSFQCKDNKPASFGAHNPLPQAKYDYDRIVLPPSTYVQEKQKFEQRLPAAQKYIQEQGLNELFPGSASSNTNRLGIVMQGGTYTVVQRGLRLLGLANALGEGEIPLLVLNVIYPLVPEEILSFIREKEYVLVVEEGSPALIEEQIRAFAQQANISTQIAGKDVLPQGGEYVADVVREGLMQWLIKTDPDGISARAETENTNRMQQVGTARSIATLTPMPPRPPSFCTGCPERPVFTALKLLQRERGTFHISADIGCHTFATLPPFNIGSSVLGYGLSLASGGAVGPALDSPTIAIMGDGGFWHNGLTSGVANAHWNGHDAVLIILENGYASATGQQHIPSSGSTPWGEKREISIQATLKGMGIKWIKRIDAYDVAASMQVLREALDKRGPQLRVVIADQECMLARQRKEKKRKAELLTVGKPVRQAKYGVDEEVCTGDHSCMRLSGCPSLTLKHSREPLKDGPVAHVDNSCVACGLCGSAAQAATLCPSFYKAERVINPTRWQQFASGVNNTAMKWLGAL